jgi:hypothetical protein
MDAWTLAATILSEHQPGTRDLAVDPITGKIVDRGELPEERWFCDHSDHHDALGGPWPCDAVRLARLVLKKT